jgi:hypothetical protein
MSNVSYFEAKTGVLGAASALYKLIGDKITAREGIYHRGAFYEDVAAVIRKLLEMQTSPFIESEYNWSWWAGECEKRAEALGSDAQFAMKLPEPVPAGDYTTYQKITNSLDKMVSLMLGLTGQEEEDADISDIGNLTPAECVKLTHHFAVYWLGKRGGNRIGYAVDWKWLPAVVGELKAVYLAMGEGTPWQRMVAGVNPPAGGEVPPISWPGA